MHTWKNVVTYFYQHEIHILSYCYYAGTFIEQKLSICAVYTLKIDLNKLVTIINKDLKGVF